MAKESGSERKGIPAPSLKDKVKEAVGKGRDAFVWVREDGAVCFGNECVAIKADDKGKLNITVRPDKCGATAGAVILEHLYKTAGKGVVIEIPSELVESA